ncbi:hypothetical protein BV011_01310 [Haemophilus influenzae]|nr:hypothetical protein BV011_01310 [Haemophilus influenzae]
MLGNLLDKSANLMPRLNKVPLLQDLQAFLDDIPRHRANINYEHRNTLLDRNKSPNRRKIVVANDEFVFLSANLAKFLYALDVQARQFFPEVALLMYHHLRWYYKNAQIDRITHVDNISLLLPKT